jgi:hypothetical protein
VPLFDRVLTSDMLHALRHAAFPCLDNNQWSIKAASLSSRYNLHAQRDGTPSIVQPPPGSGLDLYLEPATHELLIATATDTFMSM